MFFLRNKPFVYTLGCNGAPQNQYALWNTEIKKQIEAKTIKEALYIDGYDQLTCLKKHFDQCKKIRTKPYYYKQKDYHLFVYKCMNF